MANPGSDDELMLEFEAMVKRAGLVIPEERKAAAFAGYKDLKRQCALLRQPRTAASEPSNTYSLVTLIKGA
jgi:hypothetical protein